MRKYFFIVALLFVSVTADAATNDSFSGLFIGGDAGMSVDLSSTNANYTYSNLFGGGADQFTHTTKKTDNRGISEFMLDVKAAYNHALGDTWYLGFGSSFFFESSREIESGPYPFSNPNNRSDRPIDYRVITEIEPKTHFDLSVEPGHAFNDRTLGYLKIAYHYMNTNIKTRGLLDSSALNGDTVFTNRSHARSFSGLGFGGGVKYRISGNWFLNISGEWVLFERKTVTGPSFRGVADESTLTQEIAVEPSWVNLKAGICYKF